MPEITQPPLQPLLWAPVFKLLERHMPYEPSKNGSIYLLDRAIACLGAIGFLLTLWWTHGSARRLFDESVAAVTVAALIVCVPLWKLAVSGSPVALLVLLFALMIRVFVSAQIRHEEGIKVHFQLLFLGLLSALMLLTHWLAIWLILGLIAAVYLAFPAKRGSVIWVAVIPFLTVFIWGGWLVQQSGDPLGGAKTLFQSHLLALNPSLPQRNFSIVTQSVSVDDLLRKMGWNWANQFGDGVAYLGHSVPALAFFVALLHPFRRSAVMKTVYGLGCMFFTVAVGMGMIGLEEKTMDENALYLVLVPAMAIFGSAMLAVLWSRLQVSGGYFWQRYGFAVIAVGLSAVPMLATLPADLKMGLTLRNRLYPHWPPYVPDRVAVVNKLLDENEMLFSDAPWFVAWYADVATAWIPTKRADFTAMQEAAHKHGVHVAGLIVTPLSSKITYLHEAFSGPYSEWPDLVFRGPMLALDRDFQPRPDFPYKIALPLVAIPVGVSESLSMQMTFYTDKMRTIKNRTPTPQ